MLGNCGLIPRWASPSASTAAPSSPAGSSKAWASRAAARSMSRLASRHHDTAAPYAKPGPLTGRYWRCPMSPQSGLRNPVPPWARPAAAATRRLPAATPGPAVREERKVPVSLVLEPPTHVAKAVLVRDELHMTLAAKAVEGSDLRRGEGAGVGPDVAVVRVGEGVLEIELDLV